MIELLNSKHRIAHLLDQTHLYGPCFEISVENNNIFNHCRRHKNFVSKTQTQPELHKNAYHQNLDVHLIHFHVSGIYPDLNDYKQLLHFMYKAIR
jgi:hypothetical protein